MLMWLKLSETGSSRGFAVPVQLVPYQNGQALINLPMSVCIPGQTNRLVIRFLDARRPGCAKSLMAWKTNFRMAEGTKGRCFPADKSHQIFAP
ncbi:unnamed protein product [Protopolystoma xenopodis]|uniref:Uncharacterized protein n=1 Tax=Protopolystoma xenopodis TaxID=117903 RepID=A0A448XN82_9PLAT|nr:unnamed protein product [Protopolystoma xenopodis]